ncbi:hypothetical protein HZA76_03515 [Candidatus Roizmanbacteria bacterium]|nr:hypothetical protein [Candidatus Roizmanbacteria bacterium]
MKTKLILVIFIFLSLFGLVNSIKAQTKTVSVNQQSNTEKLRKYGVVFPIAELGNCADFISCHTFCADSANIDACKTYGKKKGFYNEQQEINKKRLLLQKAKLELNCTEETCKFFCEQKENSEKCDIFRKRYKPETERVKTILNQEMVTKAKLLIGCATPEACKSLCEQENNKKRCSDFFRQLGLRKEKKVEDTGFRRISPQPIKLEREEITASKSPEENIELKTTPTPSLAEETKTTEININLEKTITPEVKGASTEENLFIILFQKILDIIK